MDTLIKENKNKLIGSKTPMSKQLDKRIEIRNQLFKEVKIIKSTDLLAKDYTEIPTLSLPHLNNAIVVFTEEGVKLVNMCSDSYKLITIKDILLKFESILNPLFDYEATYRHSNHCKFFVDYIIKDPVKNFTDTICPRIGIQHSYSGDISFSVSLGFYRQICSNGVHAINYDDKIKSRHTKNRLNMEVDRIEDVISEFVENSTEYIKPFRKMAETKITNFDDRLEAVIKSTGFPKSLKYAVTHRANLESKNFVDKTDWLLYNAMNYQLNHNNDLKMQELFRRELDKKLVRFFTSDFYSNSNS